MKESLIIDNAGFDVEAMAQMSEKDFVDLHLENDSICRGKPEAERRKHLKFCYRLILEKSKPALRKKPDPVPGDSK